jgi:hypothetical protein
VSALTATARSEDGGCVGQGHSGGNAPWWPVDDEGIQWRCAVAFDDDRQTLAAGDSGGRVLQHE